MIQYKTIPPHVRLLMDAIIKIIPGSVVAGGYVRDTLLGIPPRDIDVLTESVTAEQLADLGRLLADDPGLMEESRAPTEPGTYAPEPGRESQIIALFQGGGVDVIVTNNLAAHLREFPDNISRVHYGVDGLHFGVGFHEGHEEKRIVYRDAAQPPRLLKLIAKFPDYKVEHQ